MAIDIKGLVEELRNCPCGRSHEIKISSVEISEGAVYKTPEIIRREISGNKLHVVCDNNTINASEPLPELLEKAGFELTWTKYENLRKATMEEVDYIIEQAKGADAILSVGTGSLNDICRYACYKTGQQFIIFATAPSMDGFLSQQAPIMTNGFKLTYNAIAPKLLIADVNILADSPTELKAAGLGDLIGKYTALADWEVATLTTGEYYCEAMAQNMRKAVNKAVELARSGVAATHDKAYAEALMEALVLSGLMIYLAGCTRPASGAEHHLSHFWEMQYAARGMEQLYHGKKVGIAAAIVADIYHKLAKLETVETRRVPIDEKGIREAFGDKLSDAIIKENTPNPLDLVDPDFVRENWGKIREIVNRCVPTGDEIRSLLVAAGGEPDYKSAGISGELGQKAIHYGFYARFRITLLRIGLDMVVHTEDIFK